LTKACGFYGAKPLAARARRNQSGPADSHALDVGRTMPRAISELVSRTHRVELRAYLGNRGEGLRKVALDVLNVLAADRNTDQVLGHT